MKERNKEVFTTINSYRQSCGKIPMQWNDFCAQKAQEHTDNMANEKIGFSHDGWNERYKAIAREIHIVKSGSENIAFSMPDMDPVEAWKKSTGHNKNMLSDANICGIGYAQKNNKYYYTAIFMKIKENELNENLP